MRQFSEVLAKHAAAHEPPFRIVTALAEDGMHWSQGETLKILHTRTSTVELFSTPDNVDVEVFDMRANMPSFGKRTPLTHQHFVDFEKAYGTDSLGKSKCKDQREEGRFRCFTREQIAGQIMAKLRIAMEEMEVLSAILETSG